MRTETHIGMGVALAVGVVTALALAWRRRRRRERRLVAWLQEALVERRCALSAFLAATAPGPEQLSASLADLRAALAQADRVPVQSDAAVLAAPTLAAERAVSRSWESYLLSCELVATALDDSATDAVTACHNRVAVAAALVRHALPRRASEADLFGDPTRPWQTLRASRPTRTPST